MGACTQTNNMVVVPPWTVIYADRVAGSVTHRKERPPRCVNSRGPWTPEGHRMPPPPYITPSETREFATCNGNSRGEHYVYLASDKRGRILYIGQTVDLFARFAQHRQQASWYPDLAHVKVDVFHHRDDALRWERYLIERWNPPHNIDHVNRRSAESIRWARQHAEWRARRVPELLT
jgi:predicted GIY-YIG superfamily endonuclease